MTPGPRAFQALLRITVPVVLLSLYSAFAASHDSAAFPPLGRILSALLTDWLGPRLTADVLPSLMRIVVGFGLAALIGTGIGLAAATHPRLIRALLPMATVLRSLPPAALLPIVLLAPGTSEAVILPLVVIACLIPTLRASLAGIAALDPHLRDAARSCATPRALALREVLLPNALPAILSGLRHALGLAVVMTTVAEFAVATEGPGSGIGFAVAAAERQADTPQMWAGIIVLGLIGAALRAALGVATARLQPQSPPLRAGG